MRKIFYDDRGGERFSDLTNEELEALIKKAEEESKKLTEWPPIE